MGVIKIIFEIKIKNNNNNNNIIKSKHYGTTK